MAHSLTVYDSGNTIFGGAVGGSAAGEELSSLETFGTDPLLYGSVTTTGAQIYHDIVTLGSDIILTGESITFDSTVKSDGSNYSLTVLDAGSTVINGAVGGDGTVASEKLSSLNISSVGDTALKGIQATGPISVVTSTGNLIVDGNISTLDTSANAIQLNAGKDIAAGTATGGNIIINDGTITVGTGGIATLYTGSVLNSTGLTNLIGSGSGRFRYNSDEAVTNYLPSQAPLTTGLNAIYRESPSVAVALTNETIDSMTGVQNNDPVTNIVSLIALGYAYPTVTLTDNTKSLPDVYVLANVDDKLLNPSPAKVDDLVTEEVVSTQMDDVPATDDEAGSNLPASTLMGELSTGAIAGTPAASGIISGIGPLTHVAVGSLVPSGTNTYNGTDTMIPVVPTLKPEEIVAKDVNNNEADKNADLVKKLLMTGGAAIILGGGSLLLSKNFRISQNNIPGKHAKVSAHLDHGYQHLNSDVLPKDLDQKREVSVRIHLDMGIQEVQVRDGLLVNSD